MYARATVTTRGISESGPPQCSKCSTDRNETDNSILRDNCGCWIHVSCTNIPAQALNILELEGVLWFCVLCSRTMKKLTKLKNTSDAEFRADVEAGLAEIKTANVELKAKSPSLTLAPDKNSGNQLNTDMNSKLDMEITISGVSEFPNPDSSKKPKSGDIVTHEIRNVAYILNCLDEDDCCVTNIRRLGKFKADNKPRSLLVTFNNPWAARKILARNYRLKRHNEENNTNIVENHSLSKEEQQKRKNCLTKSGN